MYTVEEDLNCYTVRDDEGTYSSLVATCSNADDAARIARALNLEAAMGEVREKIDAEAYGYALTYGHNPQLADSVNCAFGKGAMFALAALDRAGEVAP